MGVMTIGKAGTTPPRKVILWTLQGSGHMEQRLWSLAVRAEIVMLGAAEQRIYLIIWTLR